MLNFLFKKKNKIGLIVGEDADIGDVVIKENDISVYPFIVSWEVLSKNNNNLYSEMRKANLAKIKTTPKTAHPSVGFFKQMFEEKLNKYQEVIVFCISSSLSGCYNTAFQAKKMLGNNSKRVYIIDSQSSVGGIGFLTLLAVEMIKNRYKTDEIIRRINDLIPKINIIIMIKNHVFLEAGGRINKATAIILKYLSKIGVRPLLGLKGKDVKVLKMKMGTNDMVKALTGEMKERIEKLHPDEFISLIISHGDCEEDAIKLKKNLEMLKKPLKILLVNKISSVIGAHSGPDSLVISYITQSIK
jgi:DegV family protein with EDD domain